MKGFCIVNWIHWHHWERNKYASGSKVVNMKSEPLQGCIFPDVCNIHCWLLCVCSPGLCIVTSQILKQYSPAQNNWKRHREREKKSAIQGRPISSSWLSIKSTCSYTNYAYQVKVTSQNTISVTGVLLNFLLEQLHDIGPCRLSGSQFTSLEGHWFKQV